MTAARLGTGAVLETGAAAITVAGYPLRQRGLSDVELGRDVSDRAALPEHLDDSSLSYEHGQRGIAMGHGPGFFPADGCLDTTHRAGQGPFLHSLPADYNVMTRNTKHGLGGLLKTVARELGEHGIRADAVAPGKIATPMTGQTDQGPRTEERPGVPPRRPPRARPAR